MLLGFKAQFEPYIMTPARPPKARDLVGCFELMMKFWAGRLPFEGQVIHFEGPGSKRHTIRGVRKLAPMVGEICHCYVNPRQKSMRLLGRWECTKVETIRMYETKTASFGVAVFIDGVGLDCDEKNLLAWHDGFRKG